MEAVFGKDSHLSLSYNPAGSLHWRLGRAANLEAMRRRRATKKMPLSLSLAGKQDEAADRWMVIRYVGS